jgi:hypothetical protein
MPEISNSASESEVVGSFVQGVVTVTGTEIEAKVGGSRKDGRQMLRIFNKSSVTIYFGPTGVTTTTGEPLLKGQGITIPANDSCAVFLIAASGSNDVIVSEWA